MFDYRTAPKKSATDETSNGLAGPMGYITELD
jgi:hypothetical protein